jgi:hypothetical protein
MPPSALPAATQVSRSCGVSLVATPLLTTLPWPFCRRSWRENPAAHAGASALSRRVMDIARDIRHLPVAYEEWQVVYRQAL